MILERGTVYRGRMMSTVLVTGGAGYIGSHTCLELLAAGYRVIVLDNLANSSPVALDRVRELAGPDAPELVLHKVDLRDRAALAEAVSMAAAEGAGAVVHFAGLKAVAESVTKPLDYYENNVVGTLNLVRVMEASAIRRIVFSSSATVYGEPAHLPLSEDEPRWAFNPYGRTKLFIEEILQDVTAAWSGWRTMLLRYFNPVGAHPSGRIGEDPLGIPNNLMPNVMQVAVGRRPYLRVFGNDYDTPDGTCIRDYVHVVDLAAGHVAALQALDSLTGCQALNLGTGQGYSVLEVIAAAGRAVGHDIPYRIEDRRPGDVPSMYADPKLASRLLGWTATRGLDDMCRDHWAWQKANPNGYT
jgi:UDP-glucose 4-epimerase